MTLEKDTSVENNNVKPTTDNDGVKKLSGITLLSDGFRFHFEIGGHKIEAWGSSKSGKESVSFDGSLVSEKRSLRRKSLHSFEHQGVLYEVEFNMVNMLTSELHCSLIKEGVHVETQKVMPKSTSSKKEFFKGFFTWFIVGSISGFVAMTVFLNYFDK
ncbi:hypothetical protein N9L48_06845 [Psychrosphaera sp.]|nr:hypothetical protein [Psychrosphaera sp.]